MIKKFKQSLTVKIFFITSVLLILACFATYGFITWYMPMTYTIAMDRGLDESIEKLLEDLSKANLPESGEILTNFEKTLNADIYLFNEETGEEVTIPGFSNLAEANTVTVVSGDELEDSVETESYVSMSSDNVYSVTFADSEETYSLLVTTYIIETVNQVSDVLKSVLPWLIVVVLLIAFLGALFYSWYVTRPIIRMSNISKKMADLEFDWQCQEKRTDEIGVLANSLNEMSEKLSTALAELQEANSSLLDDIEYERKLEQQRISFFSAVSHELKTPITVIKGQLEGMIHKVGVYQDRDKFLIRSLKVADNLDKMVQEIMMIARMEFSEFELKKVEFNFSYLVEQQAEAIHELCLQKNQTITANIEENLMINGDKSMISKVISNLISNGVHYSPDNASIFIKAYRRTDGICFIIENTKAHIPEEELSKIFQAFYRVEKSRNRQTGGSGLGLYLVKMILGLHEAQYHMENTASGVQFSLTI